MTTVNRSKTAYATVCGQSRWYPTWAISHEGKSPAWGRVLQVKLGEFGEIRSYNLIQLRPYQQPAETAEESLPDPQQWRCFLVGDRNTVSRSGIHWARLPADIRLWRMIGELHTAGYRGNHKLLDLVGHHPAKIVWGNPTGPTGVALLEEVGHPSELAIQVCGHAPYDSPIWQGDLGIIPCAIEGAEALPRLGRERQIYDHTLRGDGRFLRWFDREQIQAMVLVHGQHELAVTANGHEVVLLPPGGYLLIHPKPARNT